MRRFLQTFISFPVLFYTNFEQVLMQKYVYENIINRFKLTDMDYKFDNHTKYFIYDLIENQSLNDLKLVDKNLLQVLIY